MAIYDQVTIPASAQDLPIAYDYNEKLFICFISSIDPVTKQPWCPDVRAALPRLEKIFGSQDAPKLAYVHVGQKLEWNSLENKYRKDWGISAVPTLVCFQRINNTVEATGRLVEGELIDDEKLSSFAAQ
ncbi:hypothetical protein DE146DRAFT_707771 [Phaeosphaeria sp. MPI-PUGE-AT-0046c]|nr:hypothetical protein DE146DRAFT_707771 [Phaeosphaeria sp. MPI-PUGE-AT-0046c]